MINLQTPERQIPFAEEGSLTTIDVVRIWSTIQGEGPFVGMPAVFVRFAGCNLQCPKCFGVAIKSRIPYLSRSVGPKIRLDKIEEGETILTFDEDMKLVETKVKKVLKRTVSRWIEIRINGKTYDVTREHPFFTTRGLILAKDLVVGDVVLEAKPEEIIAFKKTGDRNPMKDPEVAARSTANTDYVKVGKKISKTRRKMFASGELIPTFFTLSPDRQEEVRRRQSEAKRREKNPNWTGNNTNFLDVKELIEEGLIIKCQRCGKKKKRLLIHHKDGDHDNDQRSNLAVWCHACHNQHHERGYNFWNGNRKDGKQLIQAHNGQTIEKVKRCVGSLPVLNLSCEPYNTFLANGMWVHNCDTDYTTDRKPMTVGNIRYEVERLSNDKKVRLVVITGGEPFRQEAIGSLVRELIAFGFIVQIETNGTLYVEDFPWASPCLSIVCSPKTSTVHEKVVQWVSAWKYVVEDGKVDPKDGLPTSVLGNDGVRPFRPPSSGSQVFVQPVDNVDGGDPNDEYTRNELNTQQAIDSCIKFGYRLSIQLHKVIGVD